MTVDNEKLQYLQDPSKTVIGSGSQLFDMPSTDETDARGDFNPIKTGYKREDDSTPLL